ncbi:unnamed protein product [Caenorhabditis auriculariae]|uniref:Rho guanine nucleotide exchange factor 6/7 coiled-coil domain-containing protein n=1 Tax=Caenorhabditis auriculariae TaxID=2777116 RepID=A0A8S1GVB7_9PELO|nr:unnamed protein product [Caenorhabditis auriculariae]
MQDHAIVESHAPQLIVAEDERILVEEMVGDEVVFQEKSIVDAVYSIKDQLANLQNEFHRLNKVVEMEQKARRRLEHFLPKSISNNTIDSNSALNESGRRDSAMN